MKNTQNRTEITINAQIYIMVDGPKMSSTMAQMTTQALLDPAMESAAHLAYIKRRLMQGYECSIAIRDVTQSVRDAVYQDMMGYETPCVDGYITLDIGGEDIELQYELTCEMRHDCDCEVAWDELRTDTKRLIVDMIFDGEITEYTGIGSERDLDIGYITDSVDAWYAEADMWGADDDEDEEEA